RPTCRRTGSRLEDASGIADLAIPPETSRPSTPPHSLPPPNLVLRVRKQSPCAQFYAARTACPVPYRMPADLTFHPSPKTFERNSSRRASVRQQVPPESPLPHSPALPIPFFHPQPTP